jgi:hypothetical protein
MSGWLVSLTYETQGQAPFLQALFGSWLEDRDDAVRAVAGFDAAGSKVAPRIVGKLDDSMLRGLRLNPGQTGLLGADQKRP